MTDFIVSIRFLAGVLVGAVIGYMIAVLMCGAAAGDSDKPQGRGGVMINQRRKL